MGASCDGQVHTLVHSEPKAKELTPSMEETLETRDDVTVYPIGCSASTRVQNSCLPVLVTS